MTGALLINDNQQEQLKRKTFFIRMPFCFLILRYSKKQKKTGALLTDVNQQEQVKKTTFFFIRMQCCFLFTKQHRISNLKILKKYIFKTGIYFYNSIKV